MAGEMAQRLKIHAVRGLQRWFPNPGQVASRCLRKLANICHTFKQKPRCTCLKQRTRRPVAISLVSVWYRPQKPRRYHKCLSLSCLRLWSNFLILSAKLETHSSLYIFLSFVFISNAYAQTYVLFFILSFIFLKIYCYVDEATLEQSFP